MTVFQVRTETVWTNHMIEMKTQSELPPDPICYVDWAPQPGLDTGSQRRLEWSTEAWKPWQLAWGLREPRAEIIPAHTSTTISLKALSQNIPEENPTPHAISQAAMLSIASITTRTDALYSYEHMSTPAVSPPPGSYEHFCSFYKLSSSDPRVNYW